MTVLKPKKTGRAVSRVKRLSKKKLKTACEQDEQGRIERISQEFANGVNILSQYENAISIFGSSRLRPHDEHYKLAEETSYLLAKAGYQVISGGGPGIMEAANKGAKKAGGVSIGLNIYIPTEQKANQFVTTLVEFHYFFIRKVMFVRYAKAFVIFPGGYGTLDELFESINLIQTSRIPRFPVILVGSQYWRGLLHWIMSTVLRRDCIGKHDLSLFSLVDKPEDVIGIINRFYGKSSHKSEF